MKYRATAWLAATAMMAAPASAQQTDYRQTGSTQAEGRIMLGLVLPLGGKKAERAPQVELRMTRDRLGGDGQRLLGSHDTPFVSRISLTLDGQERLFVNGREFRQDDRQGVSTLGAIAIGFGVAVLIGGALVYDAARDASD
jgi:hypothetical protein